MFIDARSLQNGTNIEADVCVIGGGVAGITLALEFEKRALRTCLVESGGFSADNQTRDLYRGMSTDLPYHFADGCRSRFFGGSSNCWGGWCRPLDEIDFAPRAWVPYSGWPLTRSELEPYYARSHEILQLGPYNYEPQFWESAIGRGDVKRLPLITGRMCDSISQFSPPIRMGSFYRAALQHSRWVRVYLYANAIDIETDPEGQTVQRIRLATLSGRTLAVKAKIFVLATGAIENARLMLGSNKVQTAGVGNGHDLVGRFFMDHPRLTSGSVRFLRPWARNRLFDRKYHYHSAAVAAYGTRVAAQFALTPEVQQQEGLLNARVGFVSVFPGDGTAAEASLIWLKRRLQKKERPDWSVRQAFFTLAQNPLDTIGCTISRFFYPHCLAREVKFLAIAEPEPDPEARVTLSSERDQLGLNRVRVGWRLGARVRRTFDRNFALLSEELQRAGIASVTLDPPLEGSTVWPKSLETEGTWHHMGTTRMHDSPKHGVVDCHCRVHGIANLYVAGSSVFPTAGANFPTITIVALALRLAEHITYEVQSMGIHLPPQEDSRTLT